MMCGIPGSGKTTRAQQIKEHLEKKFNKDVVLVNEAFVKLDKKEYYIGWDTNNM